MNAVLEAAGFSEAQSVVPSPSKHCPGMHIHYRVEHPCGAYGEFFIAQQLGREAFQDRLAEFLEIFINWLRRILPRLLP